MKTTMRNDHEMKNTYYFSSSIKGALQEAYKMHKNASKQVNIENSFFHIRTQKTHLSQHVPHYFHEINFKNWVSLRTIAHRIYIHPSFDGEYFFSFFGGEFTGCVFDGMLFRKTACSRHAVDGASKHSQIY